MTRQEIFEPDNVQPSNFVFILDESIINLDFQKTLFQYFQSMSNILLNTTYIKSYSLIVRTQSGNINNILFILKKGNI